MSELNVLQHRGTFKIRSRFFKFLYDLCLKLVSNTWKFHHVPGFLLPPKLIKRKKEVTVKLVEHLYTYEPLRGIVEVSFGITILEKPVSHMGDVDANNGKGISGE